MTQTLALWGIMPSRLHADQDPRGDVQVLETARQMLLSHFGPSPRLFVFFCIVHRTIRSPVCTASFSVCAGLWIHDRGRHRVGLQAHSAFVTFTVLIN